MINKIKNIFIKISYILIIVYLIIFIPGIWGHKPLVILSGSMEPTLKVGGIMYYYDTDISNLNKGDILVYQQDTDIISHRIVDIDDNGIITKGDVNNITDYEKVDYNKILGKGTNWSIPYIGHYAKFVYNHKVILYILVIIVAIDDLIDIIKKRKGSK